MHLEKSNWTPQETEGERPNLSLLSNNFIHVKIKWCFESLFTAFRCYHLLLQAHQIYRSYFEMCPLQLMQLVWPNFTEVILKCVHYNSCNLSDQIYRSYFEMCPLQLMQLVWSNLQKLFWNASSVATHATCLITLMPYRNTLELQLHMVTKNHRKVSFWKKHYTRTCRMKAQSISFLKIKRSAVVELWSTLKVLGSKISRFTTFVTWTHDQFY
jgi:hypothetical protein